MTEVCEDGKGETQFELPHKLLIVTFLATSDPLTEPQTNKMGYQADGSASRQSQAQRRAHRLLSG